MAIGICERRIKANYPEIFSVTEPDFECIADDVFYAIADPKDPGNFGT